MDIADRRVATLHFTLTGEDGQPITSTRGHDPLTYLHGTGGIARGMEEALAGRKAGDRFQVTVTPDAGFGPRHDGLVQTLSKRLWNGQGDIPAVGGKLAGETAKGPIDAVVTAVDADTVTVDGNHPLAGRTFVADIEVLDVRLATPQELQFGVG